MRILCIEDSPTDAELVQRMTKAARHQGTFVSNLQDAKKVLESVTPNLILLDVVLDHTRVGDTFVRDLRALGYTLPIIAVTALGLPQDIRNCLEAGFTEVLTKPYEISQLAALFSRYQT